MRLIHASLGMQTESAEFSDTIKKHIFYGKPLDVTNLKEEIGDMLWYVAIALDSLGSSFEEVMETNIKKLKARYGEKFSEESAITRNLIVERAILEE
jgi:NTP pyrophosphatase (non-canonical NTP hydrolase)